MNLLALNLHRASSINVAIYGINFLCMLNVIITFIWLLKGNFSGPKQQEIVVAKVNTLELLRPDDTGKVISICSTPFFSIIRSIFPFRLSGKVGLLS